MSRMFVYAALALAIPLWTVQAQDRKDPVERKEFKDAKDRPLDREFLIAANVNCHAQTQYAKLVDRRAAREDVKNLAKQILDDHQKACDRIGEIVKDRKLAIVAGTEREVRERLDDLGKLREAEFDRAYLRRLVDDHERVIAMFEHQVKAGKDTAISDFARETLPTLKKHLQKAKELQMKSK